MTLLVRDEQDVLRDNIAFHLANGVDEIVLMDNLSVDGTAEIARDFERSGRLHYTFQPQDDYAQGRWVTQMARRACEEFGADWVINADADEFWWPHEGSLKDALAAIPFESLAASVERTNFVARTANGEPFWRRMDVRRAVSTNALGRPLPGKVAHRARPGVVVDQGNHRVALDGTWSASVPAPITILHYPVRTHAQYENKIAKGGAAYARNAELDPGIGETWRQLHRRLIEGTFAAAAADEVLSDDAVAEGLAAGTLVRDHRLIDAMAALL